jgi:hypothetical protein
MVETQLFIAGSNGVFPPDIGPFHEIVVSYAAGAGKQQPAIDLREMHAMVAKRLGVTPANLICAIAFDQTANVVCDMEFAEFPNVQLICPHLVKARGGAYAAPKIPAFVLSPAYQTILAELAELEAKGGGSASSASSSASSPAKSPAAQPAHGRGLTCERPWSRGTCGSPSCWRCRRCSGVPFVWYEPFENWLSEKCGLTFRFRV